MIKMQRCKLVQNVLCVAGGQWTVVQNALLDVC